MIGILKIKVSLGCARQYLEFSLVLMAHSNSVDLNKSISYLVLGTEELTSYKFVGQSKDSDF